MKKTIRETNHSTGIRRAPINPRFNNGRFQAINGRQMFALLTALLIVVSSLLVRVQAAADGDLDLTFDADGKVTTSFLGGFDAASSVATQSDGKIVVAGYVSDMIYEQVLGLARYNTDGSLDPTFGTGGIVSTTFFLSSLRVDVKIQNDGKIVVLGTMGGIGVSSQFLIARYDTSGNPDPSFGTSGSVQIQLFGIYDEAGSLAIQSDGKIVVAGKGNGLISDFVLARFETNGDLDQTFGTGGKVVTDFFGSFDFANDVAIQSDGKIIVVGAARNAINLDSMDFGLACYNTDGSLDASFGTGGKATIDFDGRYDEARAVAIQQNDGKIVLAGRVDNLADNTTYYGDFGVARFETNGVPDATFGTGGKVITDFFGAIDLGNDVAIQEDGKIVVAGSVNPDDINVELRWDFGLARYDTNGNLDPTFGTGGKVVTDFLHHDEAGGVAIQQGCKIVVVGFSWPHETGDADFALARYDSSGCAEPGEEPGEEPGMTCPWSQGHWKNNPSAWPVDSLTLGSQAYTKTELLAILNNSTQTDASLNLARQLIAAKLNVANGSDPAPVSSTIAHADSLLSGYGGKLPYKVKSSSAIGQQMVADANVLDSYNNRLLTPDCVP